MRRKVVSLYPKGTNYHRIGRLLISQPLIRRQLGQHFSCKNVGKKLAPLCPDKS
jgi:hypothetical protein